MKPDDEVSAIKTEVMHLVQAYDNGISECELARTMSSTDGQRRAVAINALMNEGKIMLCKRGSELIYRAQDNRVNANHSALLGANVEEKLVYRVVESAGSKGIWHREIRNQTKLPMNLMSKILKNLETKKLIKAVKSVTASKKKLYMLYGIEPDKTVTGGAWYSGTEFEAEYVQVLYEQCYQFVKKHLVSSEESKDFVESRKSSLVSSAEVRDYIKKLKVSTIELSLQDIETVLETIVFDGLIEKISVANEQCPSLSAASTKTKTIVESSVPVKTEKSMTTSDEEELDTENVTHFYRALPKVVNSTGVMRSPCGHCPYVQECRPNAVINPDSCLYIERWFSTSC